MGEVPQDNDPAKHNHNIERPWDVNIVTYAIDSQDPMHSAHFQPTLHNGEDKACGASHTT